MSSSPSVSDTQLRALLAGSLPDDEANRLEAALETDPELRTRLEALSGAADFPSEFAPPIEEEEPPEPDAEDLSDLISSLKADPTSVAPSPNASLIANILGPPHESNSIGSLGPYEVEGHLATGGMGVVYKARDPQLKRQVAIKVLSPHFVGQEEAVQRFLREATAAAAIEHPNVLPIHAIDTESAELPFLVMRFVDGPSVEKLIAERKGPLQFEQVLAIAKAVAAALTAAHAKDLTHRDVKPSNILLESEPPTAEGEKQTIYLTDFGLARIADDASLTRPGTFLGTPQFSSPEQARGELADHRSDLFSLGAVLYTMATGASPFSGEDNSLTSVVYRVVHEPHPPTLGVNPALPAWFASLVDRLLAKNPDDRPSSASLVTRCLETESLDPLTPGTRPNRTREVLLAATLLVALLTLSLLFLNPFKSDAPVPGAPSSPGAQASSTDLVVNVVKGDGTRVRHASVVEAIAAAEDRDTIEIAHDGRLNTPPLVIPPGKTLTLRASEGSHPILHLDDPTATLLTSESSLVLEGLTLSALRTNDPTLPPLIRIDAPSFAAAGCRFELPTGLRPRRRSLTLSPASIELSGTARCKILNCELIGLGSGGIRHLQPSSSGSCEITIRNSLFVSESGLELHGGTTDRAAFEVTVDRNFLSARSPLIIFGNNVAFPVTMEVSDNLFTSDTTIIDTPLRIRDLFENVKWTEHSNVYSCGGLLARAGDRSARPNTVGLTTMTQWKAMFGTEIGGSIKHDLHYRTHLGTYLLNPTKITARMLHDVPAPPDPLPTTGPVTDQIGPGDAYHQWKKSAAATEWLQ